MSDFNFFLPISKVDKERRQVSGYASTPAKDMDGEIITLDAIKAALPGYMEWRNVRAMHRPEAVGVAKEASMDSKGLFLTAKIVDEDAWQKCLEGVYKGFSIGGRKVTADGNTITAIDLIEISIVDRPANPECRFDVQKGAKVGPAYLLKAKRDPQSKALGLMAKAVQTLAKDGPPAAHDGFSLPAKPAVPVEKAAACKAHDVAGCADCSCSEHGSIDCDKCSVAKREFSSSERDADATSGKALPDGSFPIENASDLSNAVSAFGRAKDKPKAKAHIVARARTLGLTDKLPEKWSRKIAKKEAKAAKKATEKAAKAATIAESLSLAKSSKSARPSFLSLGADDGPAPIENQQGFGHEPFLKLGKGGREAKATPVAKIPPIEKRMSAAGSLAYCFDQIREVQRSLMVESSAEGGDGKDSALAQKLGSIASKLAGVIGQKAEHEGAEALDLSDADDQWIKQLMERKSTMAKAVTNYGGDPLTKAIMDVLKAGKAPTKAGRLEMAKSNLKKARKAANEMEDCIKAAHAMHKAAYLAKAAGTKKEKPDADGEFDHQGAMEKLQKAFNDLTSTKTFIKAASEQIKKVARAGQRGQEATDGNAFFEVPAGVKELSPDHMATLGPGGEAGGSMPPELMLDGAAFSGKAAKLFKGYISFEHAAAIARAAAAEAENSLLKSMPANNGGRRPYAFDLSKVAEGKYADDGNGAAQLPAELFKGVNTRGLTSDDEEIRKSSVGKVIGNMILGGTGGKPVFDPSFHGTAGA